MRASEASRTFREIVVFLPDEGKTERPTAVARALTTALGVGRADYGIDALTGAVELRLMYDPALFVAARDFLSQRDLAFEIGRR